MKTLLKLTGEFATQWTAADPDGRIIERYLADGSIPYISGHWIEAAYTPESARTDAQRNRLALSDSLIDEVLRADGIVLGIPVDNFSFPSDV